MSLHITISGSLPSSPGRRNERSQCGAKRKVVGVRCERAAGDGRTVMEREERKEASRVLKTGSCAHIEMSSVGLDPRSAVKDHLRN